MDWHYHANHVDAPARGARTTAEKDARTLRLLAKMYADDRNGWLEPPGPGFNPVVKCFRADCKIVPKGEAI